MPQPTQDGFSNGISFQNWDAVTLFDRSGNPIGTISAPLVVELAASAGSSAVTAADGALVTLGTTTDAAVTNPATAKTVIQALGGLLTQAATGLANWTTLQAKIPALSGGRVPTVSLQRYNLGAMGTVATLDGSGPAFSAPSGASGIKLSILNADAWLSFDGTIPAANAAILYSQNSPYDESMDQATINNIRITAPGAIVVYQYFGLR